MKNNIRRIREKLGLTQVEAAKRISMPQCTYSQIETGRSIFELDEMMRFCIEFNVKPEQVYPVEVVNVIYSLNIAPVKTKRQPAFIVRVPEALAQGVDEAVLNGGYNSRSEFVIDLVRRAVLKV